MRHKKLIPTTMNLETERLVLTEISWDDLEDIHQLHSIFEVDEFNTLGIPVNIEETRSKIALFVEAKNENTQSRYTWRINDKQTHAFIGLAGIKLSLDRFKMGEIFYKLHPVYWGKGYATEVSKQIIKTGFDIFQLHRIEAGCAVKNDRSIRVLEKSGMTREGTYRKILPIRGEWIDSYGYSILDEEKIQK